MFSKAGTIELHAAMHERFDLLLRHVATVPDDLQHRAIGGFGHPSIWKQLVHILTCEEGWVHDLQNRAHNLMLPRIPWSFLRNSTERGIH
jgi:uncharacterized damage-inducible protein DinB